MTLDVMIVGGGMVGLSLACALGNSPLQVGLVESSSQTKTPPVAGFDVRVSALTLASEAMLKNIGAWEHIAHERLGVFREMQVWDAGSSGSVHFDGAQLGQPHLGYIAENCMLQVALERRIAALSNVHWYRPAAVEEITVKQAHAELRLDSTRLRARLVVAADGARSRVREGLGIPVHGKDYQQHAVVAVVQSERPHAETAWQKFLATGPLAVLPLPGNFSAIVWSTTPELAVELKELDEVQFCQHLDEALESRFGGFSLVGARGVFPLRRQHAQHYTEPRVALIGDAAHTVHPLAGQGANLGFLDAIALAEVLRDALVRKRDPGSLAVLRRYERWRKGHNHLVQRSMDGFHWLFVGGGKGRQLVRGLGLSMTDRVPLVKQEIMRFAAGMQGDLPLLTRPDAKLWATR